MDCKIIVCTPNVVGVTMEEDVTLCPLIWNTEVIGDVNVLMGTSEGTASVRCFCYQAIQIQEVLIILF